MWNMAIKSWKSCESVVFQRPKGVLNSAVCCPFVVFQPQNHEGTIPRVLEAISCLPQFRQDFFWNWDTQDLCFFLPRSIFSGKSP